MNIYFILQKHLDRMKDHKFKQVWVDKWMNKIPNIISILFVVYIVVVIGLGILINSAAGFFSALLGMVTFGFILGYLMVIHFIQFLAKNNERYMNIMMGQNNQEAFSYDNVVN